MNDPENGPWTAAEDKRLRDLHSQHESLEDTARMMGREEEDIEARADSLGLITVWDKVCRAHGVLDDLLLEDEAVLSEIQPAAQILCTALDALREAQPHGFWTLPERATYEEALSRRRPKWFAITGRIPGDHKDTRHVLKAMTKSAAVFAFELALWNKKPDVRRKRVFKQHGAYVFINSVVSSKTAIEDET
jgi:hypothetical protein